ncbi:hypothetical protein JCM17960_06230 [Magnetospira thiophila]
MMRLAPFFILYALVILTGVPAVAEGVRIFEAQQGAWKASCYKDTDGEAPYCHLMVLHVFADGSKTGNFVRFGPVFDRGEKGVVVASYLGFARKSDISIQVDDREPWSDPAPTTNHLVISAQVSAEILAAMAAGQQLRLTFKPATGVTQDVEVSLTDYRDLLGAVTKVMAGETVTR